MTYQFTGIVDSVTDTTAGQYAFEFNPTTTFSGMFTFDDSAANLSFDAQIGNYSANFVLTIQYSNEFLFHAEKFVQKSGEISIENFLTDILL